MIDYRKILFLSYEKRIGLRDIAKAVHCVKIAVAENCFHIHCCRMRQTVYSPQG